MKHDGRTVTALAAGLAFLDPAVVTVALPALGDGLRTDIAGLQWTMAGYALGIVALILLSAAIGDRYGHRRVHLAGFGAFAVAALACGLAPNVEVLIAARVLQGAGAALVVPTARIRQFAGIVAAGPIAGGALVSALGWRSVFVATALVAVIGVVGAARSRPVSGRPAHTRLDVAGAVLLALGLTGLAAAAIGVPEAGFGSFRVWLGAAAGLLGLVAFALVERRRQRPGVGISDREGRPRVVAMLAPGARSVLTLYTLIAYAGLGGLGFFLLIQLQTVAGYPALGAGAAVLPATGILLAFSARSGALAARIGPRRQLVLGPLLAAVGVVGLYRVGPDAVFWSDVLPGMVAVGLGSAVFLPALVSAVRPAYAVHLAAARTGPLLAVAVLPMLAGLAGAAYANPAAFHHGYRVALAFCCGALIVAAIVALAFRGTHESRRTP